MFRTVWFAALVTTFAPSCKKSDSSATAANAPGASGSSTNGSSDAPGPQGSAVAGSADAVTDAAIDGIVDDMMAYTEKVLPLLAAFDGDCAAQGERMLELEPLAQKIRVAGSALEADPAKRAAFRAKMQSKRPEVMAKVSAKLAAAGLTEADMDRREKELKEKCANDASFQQAMKRVGLRKK